MLCNLFFPLCLRHKKQDETESPKNLQAEPTFAVFAFN